MPHLLWAGKVDYQAPRRPLDQARLQLAPTNINEAKWIPETRKTSQEMGGRPRHLLTTRQNQQRQPRPHERHELAWHSGRQPTTHEQTTYTTKAHDQNEDDTKDDDDTQLILSQLIDKLNLRNTKTTSARTLVQEAATKISHDTPILSETQLLLGTDAHPLYLERQEI